MIRDATKADAQAIADIYNHYIRNTVATFEEVEVTSEDMAQRILEKQLVLVAILNDNILGFAYSGKWNARSAYRHTAEVSVYLSHEATGQGWGTRLYEAIFTHLRTKGVHAVIGGITLPNPASIALHEKFQMEKVAHFKRVGFKFGQWLDVGYWQGLL